MQDVERIKYLTDELLKHCHNYYDLDSPTISDAEYDKLYDELFELENRTNFWLANSPTRKVQGSVLDCFVKVEHSKPMLSAAKTKSTDDIKKFVGNNAFYCSYKLDGLSMVIRYKNGDFVQAISRGTGIIGEDITEQAKMIGNIPMHIPYTNDLELRGECVVSWNSFNQINENLENKYSHPRNLAAGSIRNLNTNITKERNLSYVVFECVSDLYDEDTLFDSKWDELGYLDYLGFETVERCHGTIEECVEDMKPDSYKYPVDGLIFEFCMKDYSKSLASTSHHEGCRMALKWADTTYETTLLDVEWNTTRTGMISPVAVFTPVDLDGAITTRATLHNLSIIKELELGIGDTITVYRSNMVIPKIDDNLTRSDTLIIPKKCPVCGEVTEIKQDNDSEVLICTNPDCRGKLLGKLTHFVSKNAMDIQGLSEATLKKLVELRWLDSFVDIYNLKKYKYDMMKYLDGFGEKSTKKLLDAIEESRNTTLDRFINALGIPMIGKSASKTISKYCDGDYDKFYDLAEHGFDWTQLEDFGETMCKNLNEYLDKHFGNIDDLAGKMNFVRTNMYSSNVSLSDKTFVITGSLNTFTNRDAAKEWIEAHGGKVSGSVSTKTSFLVNNNLTSTSGKNKKAIELGIKIITEDELRNMVGE